MKKKITVPLFKGFKRPDGTMVAEAWFDGYTFGERLLEGVKFKASVTEGRMSVSVGPASREYLTAIAGGAGRWMKRAFEYAQGADEFDEFEDSDDLSLELIREKPAAKGTPRPMVKDRGPARISMTSAAAIFGGRV